MSIPVIGGAGSWGNNGPGGEENPMVSRISWQFVLLSPGNECVLFVLLDTRN